MNALLHTSEGYAELGMWQEAWEALDNLSDEERHSLAVLRLRLRCCAGLEAWGLGEHLAALLREGGPLERNTVATFYHANARHLLTEGNTSAAAASLQAALDTWPDYRMALMLDPVITAEFFHDRLETSGP